jgi:hypothetical protein
MNTFETSAFLRELKIIMEIAIVQNSTDLSDPMLHLTYAEWEGSKRWLIDLGWNEEYCIN